MSLTRMFLLSAICAILFETTGALADVKEPACGESDAVTEHAVKRASGTLEYVATVGFLKITAANKKDRACLSYISYVKKGATSASKRPLLFAFNGGPGSSSVWLHLGILGPRRVSLGKEGLDGAETFEMVANESSPLDIADIVLIDPVGTGLTHVLEGSSEKSFYGVENDAISVANFVRGYLDKHNRWRSPKFILGESYGGIRAPLVAEHLQSHQSVSFSGLILVGPALHFSTLVPGGRGNELPYMVSLPSLAVTARYHHRLSAEMEKRPFEQFRAEVERFARGPYLRALLKGNGLPDSRRRAVLHKLSAYTGLSETDLDRLDLRVSNSTFRSLLLADKGKILGRYDSRLVLGALSPDDGAWTDPSIEIAGPQYVAAMNDYLIDELGFRSSRRYVDRKQMSSWPWGTDAAHFALTRFGVLDELTQVMLRNPRMKLYAAAGYYDLAVPYASTMYNLAHLSSRVKDRVSFSVCEAGHMLYTNPVCLRQFAAHLRTMLGGQPAASKQLQWVTSAINFWTPPFSIWTD